MAEQFLTLMADLDDDTLHQACAEAADPRCPWTPHITMLMDEPETICAAVPVFLKSFHPFVGKNSPVTFMCLLADAGDRIRRAVYRRVKCGAGIWPCQALK